MAERDRPLGDNQEAVLLALAAHRVWHKGCGWVYGTPSATERVLDSLETRGLVEARPFGKHGRIYFPVSGAEDVFERRHAAERGWTS